LEVGFVTLEAFRELQMDSVGAAEEEAAMEVEA